jgi:hypothetical protein
MKIMMFGKLMLLAISISLLSFALLPESTIIGTLKILALGTVGSIAISVFYPEMRGIKEGDTVSVVSDSAIPGIIGRLGIAANDGRKKEQIKILLNNGTEILGVIESYTGLISPPKIRVLYEEKLVD